MSEYWQWLIGIVAGTAGALGAVVAVVRRVRAWVRSITAKLAELESALQTRRRVRVASTRVVEAPGLPTGYTTVDQGTAGVVVDAEAGRVRVRIDGHLTEVWVPLDAIEIEAAE